MATIGRFKLYVVDAQNLLAAYGTQSYGSARRPLRNFAIIATLNKRIRACLRQERSSKAYPGVLLPQVQT